MSRAGAGAAEEPGGLRRAEAGLGGVQSGHTCWVWLLVAGLLGLWQVQDFKELRAGAGRGPARLLLQGARGASGEVKPPAGPASGQDLRAQSLPGIKRASGTGAVTPMMGGALERPCPPLALGGDCIRVHCAAVAQPGGRGVRDSQSTSSSSRTLRPSLLISLTSGQGRSAPLDPADDSAGGSCAPRRGPGYLPFPLPRFLG